MAIDFPNSPTLNQVYTVGDTSWTYDGEKWLVSAAGLVGPAGATGPAGSWATTQVVNTQTGTTYTLLTSDLGKMVTLNNSSAVTVTVGTALGLTSGQSIDLISLGSGQVTVAAGGATLTGTPGLKLRAQHSGATLYCVGTNSYVLLGDLSA